MKKLLFYKVIFSLWILIAITACGGSSTNLEENDSSLEQNDSVNLEQNPESQEKIIGYLIDAPVVNMGYMCGDKKGKTDDDGKFECSSFPIVFMIGEFRVATINKIPQDGIIYPQDLAGVDRNNINNPKVLKIASFLQSLDGDGDLSTTIDIPDSLNITNPKSLTQMTQEETVQLLESKGIVPVTLEEAEKHLRENLLHQTSRTDEGSSSSSSNNQEDTSPPNSPTVVNKYPYIPKIIDTTTAIRFLNKATFGSNKKEIEHLQKVGIEAWVDEQLAMPLQENIYLRKMIKLAKEAEPIANPYSVDEYLQDNDKVFNKEVASFHSPRYRMSAWFDIALTSKEQLRHKVTYALSQIIVESDFEPIFTRRADALGRYFDILHKNAFGNYKNLLNDISFSSSMGLFLTYNGNKKEYQNDSNITIYPDENYAREIMQLFSIGLHELNIDGTPKKDANRELTPTYTQEDVNELAKVFTGWDNQRSGNGDSNRGDRFGRVGFRRGDFTHPLEFTESYHDFGEKKILGEIIPANLSGEEDIKKAVEIIMNNQNVAPFISKNLILRLTKSNPTPEYVKRVATVFKTTRGDLKPVIKAILLDKEIWDSIKSKEVIKFKEPLIAYTNFLKAFNAKAFPKWYFCAYGGPSDDDASNCNIVTNQFLFNDTRDFLNQGAGLAPTVFNFYDNSFIPNDNTFKSNSTVAPEIQIQSDTIFINLNNRIRKDLEGWEKNYLTNQQMNDYKNQGANVLKRYDTVEAFADDAPARGYVPVYYIGADKMLLDTTEELNVMEMIIDGDSDGDFLNLKDFRESEYHDDEKAIKALINHLNEKLTGGLLTQPQIDAIYNNLKDAKLYNIYDVHDSDHPEYDKRVYILKNAIFPAIRAVVSTNTFMTE